MLTCFKMGTKMDNEKIRINKYISQSGFCSRRAADELVSQGKVTVNGEIAVQGTKVNAGDEVFVDGHKVSIVEDKRVYAFYKPVGYISSLSDEQGEGISKFLPDGERLFPVGRLDKESEGLMLLTNDGELMNEILSASNGHEKEYIVTTRQIITDDFLKKMADGVPITNGATGKKVITAPCKTMRISEKKFRITLIQGLNRQIRRMCGYFSYDVANLMRVRIMNISIKGMKPGQIELIDNYRLNELKKLIKKVDNE